MPESSLSVPTQFKVRFRLTERNAAPLWQSTGGGDASFRQDALALSRQDTTMRFLVEMDRKLDAILTLLQNASIEEDFPLRGYVLELNAQSFVLNTSASLSAGQQMELVLMMSGYPMRLFSVMGEVMGRNPVDDLADSLKCSPQYDKESTYHVAYRCLSEEEREGIIAFIFQEDRKRIRRQKEEL